MNTSAEARVIASFTFVVMLMFGGWAAIDHLVAGPSSLLPDSELARIVVGSVPLLATAVAYHATNATTAAWARTLGSATVMLGVLASIGGVLYVVAYT